MPPPLDLARIEERHPRYVDPEAVFEDSCDFCDVGWPCDAAQLVAELRRTGACGCNCRCHATEGQPDWPGPCAACCEPGHNCDCGRALFPEQPLDIERLYRAITDELVVLWGEPSDAISTQVRPIVARNIADRYLRADTPQPVEPQP